jgi:uncharacterized protein YkwD
MRTPWKRCSQVALVAALGAVPIRLGDAAPSPGEIPAVLARAMAERSVPPGAPSLKLDPSLARVAERHLSEVLSDPKRATRERIGAQLIEEGLADAQILPFTTIGGDAESQARALLDFAESTVRSRGMTHAGIAQLERAGKRGLAAIFSRRLIELAPLPRSSKSLRFVVRGRASPDTRVEAWLRSPCSDGAAVCAGDVASLPVEMTKTGVIAVAVPFGTGAGGYTLEMLAERDRGPEVAALWTFGIRGARRRGQNASAAVLDPLPNEAASLSKLVAEERKRRDLAPLDGSKALDRAASVHASAVCKLMVAAHVITPGDTPIARAKKAGFGGRVAENVAIASTVVSAHENLMASPAHRRNVLDPAASTLGVGIAAHEGGEETSYCAVEVFGYE